MSSILPFSSGRSASRVSLAIGGLLPTRAEAIFGAVQAWILSGFGWLYLLAAGIFLGSVLLLAAGRYGDLRLSPRTRGGTPGRRCNGPRPRLRSMQIESASV
ncbi:BCCT family transporter [Mesorhizobium sp. BR1-1-16]|uniref:BCCT family transporter n=1 Tax=Mesorhizobium sp. BR1-1-16 TaxID=2876653 RepID=UPI001CC919CC|nr:BCCT family transporter [Mesorhizobium sp. BR1-1-16]MBZ9937046.1 BCCT family transporter [Mesorhizobium sp. BR1-1-16]